MITISDDLLRRLLPTRETGAHKWGVGGVLVIAGSPSYPGAAWLASRSAGRNGAGIVYLATPRGVIATMAGAMPEVAYVPLPDSDAPGTARRAIDRMTDVLGKVRSVVVGPGLGDDDSTDYLLSALLGLGDRTHRSLSGFGFGAIEPEEVSGQTIFDMFDGQIVLDADGLNWLSRQESWWERVPGHRLVLTPHPGEAARLTGEDASVFVADPAGSAVELARKWQQAVVIKSGYAAASIGTEVVVADLAPTSLATAGTGDCLAGAIGGYLAQGSSGLNAATLGIGIGTRAAVSLEATFGTGGVLASDLPDMMAQTARRLHDQSRTGE
ncbi:MAG: NAD(P)H-hydrate dehydratase [Thermomicrobiales bacterium]|nr:NAD(P)H-hydrate dehydratase [Thermomicrobiales bacterium]